jgi:hypothetical protein
MRLFSRRRQDESDQVGLPDPHDNRRPTERCFACNRVVPPLVYIENGHDYCMACARAVLIELHMKPAGRRSTDLTTVDVPFDQLSPRSPRPYLGR